MSPYTFSSEPGKVRWLSARCHNYQHGLCDAPPGGLSDPVCACTCHRALGKIDWIWNGDQWVNPLGPEKGDL